MPNNSKGTAMLRVDGRKTYRWLWSAAILLAAPASVMSVSGIWGMPNLYAQFQVSQSLANNPFVDPEGHYIFYNYLGPAIFGVLGGDTFAGFAIFYTACTLLFLVLYVGVFVKVNGTDVAIADAKLLAAMVFPALWVPFYWVGMDGLTLLLMLVAVFLRSHPFGLLGGFLLGMQHFEQGCAGFLLLFGSQVLFWLPRRRREDLSPVLQSVGILAAIVLGRLALEVIFVLNDVNLAGDRSTYMVRHLDEMIGNWTQNWPAILWSLYAAGWVFIVRFVRELWPLAAATFVCFLFLMLTGDQTRVGAILLFPATMYWIVFNRSVWRRSPPRLVMLALVIHFALPVVYVWGSPFVGSLWPSVAEEAPRLFSSKGYFKARIKQVDLMKPFLPESAYRRTLDLNGAELPGNVGRDVGTRRRATDESDAEGFIAYGPYARLKKGKYVLYVKYSSSLSSDRVAGRAEVVRANLPHQLGMFGESDLPGTGGSTRVAAIPFVLDGSQASLETRVHWAGVGDFSLMRLIVCPDCSDPRGQ